MRRAPILMAGELLRVRNTFTHEDWDAIFEFWFDVPRNVRAGSVTIR